VEGQAGPGGIRLVLVARPDTWLPQYEVVASPSGEFEFSGIPRGATLWLKAFQDVDGDGVSDLCEPATARENAQLLSLLTVDIAGLILTLPPQDTVAPTLEGVPGDLVVKSIRDVPPAARVTAHDDGQAVGVEFSEAVFEPGAAEGIVRTWVARDQCGNTASASQTITVSSQSGGGAGRYVSSFEPSQGYAAGPVGGQDGWLSSDPGFLVSGQRRDRGGLQSLAALDPEVEAIRPFDAAAATVVELKFSLFLDGAAGRVPAPGELTESASAVVSYDATLGVMALDGDGSGGGSWIVVPETRLPNQWLEIRIVKDDTTSSWSLSVDGTNVLAGLGYKNQERTGLSRLRIKNGSAGSAYIDNLSLIHE
jgi:hypothetical protein